jgi:DNA-binding NarL/FixJ family response regulator
MNLLIAEDHSLTASLLANILSKDEAINVVGVVADGYGVLQAADASPVDVVLLDLSMPALDGLQTMPPLFSAHPDTKVLVLSGHSDCRFIQKSISLGARGYLTKRADVPELLNALRIVFAGGSYLDRTCIEALQFSELTANAETGAGRAS